MHSLSSEMWENIKKLIFVVEKLILSENIEAALKHRIFLITKIKNNQKQLINHEINWSGKERTFN